MNRESDAFSTEWWWKRHKQFVLVQVSSQTDHSNTRRC